MGEKRQKAAQRKLDYHNSENMDARITCLTKEMRVERGKRNGWVLVFHFPI